MTEHFPRGVRPFVRPGIEITRSGEGVSRVANPLWAIDIDPDDQARLAAVLDACDGEQDLEQIARQSQLDLEEVQYIVRDLYEQAMLAEQSDVTLDALSVFHHARACGRAWRVTVPTWAAVVHGEATAQLVLGMLIEEWQFITINPSHIGAAAQRATDYESAKAWSDFLADEFAHGDWLRNGLEAVLSPELLDRSIPLPGTTAVQNLFRHTARTNELAYASILSAGESDPTESESLWDTARATEYYPLMRKLGVLPPEVFDQFIRHARLDEHMGHGMVVRRVFERHRPLHLDERRAILQTHWSHIKTLEMLHEQIYGFYTDPENPAVYSLPEDRVPPLCTPVVLRPEWEPTWTPEGGEVAPPPPDDAEGAA